MTGDWSVTTDSTCLSERSEAFHALNQHERRQLIEDFYYKVLGETTKHAEDIRRIVSKYNTNFGELVLKLERKYERKIEESKGEQEL